MRHCCSTSDGGTSIGFFSLSFSTICSASAVSARSLSIFSSLRVHVGAELDQRLEAADVLRELVVERREDALLHVLHVRRGTSPTLPAQLLARVVVGELGLDLELVVDVLAHERRVELREDLTGAELERHALPAAVLELLAVDRRA